MTDRTLAAKQSAAPHPASPTPSTVVCADVDGTAWPLESASCQGPYLAVEFRPPGGRSLDTLPLLAQPERDGLTMLTPFSRAWPAYDRDVTAAAGLTQRLADPAARTALIDAVRGHVAANASLGNSVPEEQQRQLRYLDALKNAYAEPDRQVRHIALVMFCANPGADLTDLLDAARTATEPA